MILTGRHSTDPLWSGRIRGRKLILETYDLDYLI